MTDEATQATFTFWGDKLVTWPKDVVMRAGLSVADSEYLTTVGLPCGVDWNFEIAAPSAERLPTLFERLIVLARDGGVVPICVDLSDDKRIVAVEGAHKRPVNSSVQQFGAFLMLYQNYRAQVGELDDDAIEQLINETERKMRQLDPQAMANVEAYWPVIVEQMRDGLI